MAEYENAYNIWRKIEEYDNIALFGHVNPDGDCVSSVRAMKALITKYFLIYIPLSNIFLDFLMNSALLKLCFFNNLFNSSFSKIFKSALNCL